MLQQKQYIVNLQAGQVYYWCACGFSKNGPFCDGTHKATAMTPIMFVAEKTGEAHLCGCRKSAKKPYCDGTHNIR